MLRRDSSGNAGLSQQDDPLPVPECGDQTAEGLHLRPFGRVGETAGEGRASSIMRPGGQQGLQIGRTEEPGVHVEGSVGAAGAGRLDQGDGALGILAPPARGEVRDLKPHSGRLRGAHRLRHRLHGCLVPVARVRGVEPIHPCHLAAELGHLRLARTGLDGVFEPRGVPERPLFQALAEQVLHPIELVAARRPIGRAQRGHPELSVGHQRHHVHRRPGLLEALQIAGHGAPADRQIVPEAVDRLPGEGRIADRRAAVAAIADHFEGHPLADRAHRARVDQQGEVRMAVDVDEPRRDEEPGRIEHRRAFRGRQRPLDAGDASAGHLDVGLDRRPAAAVENRAAPDDEVRRHGHTLRGVSNGKNDIGAWPLRRYPARHLNTFRRRCHPPCPPVSRAADAGPHRSLQ